MTMESVLELPAGHNLFSFKVGQVPAPGATYRALMPGDLETLFGPAKELRGREFLLEVDGARWLAAPTPGLFVVSTGRGMAFDPDSIYARTDGRESTIDFKLLRPCGHSPT